MAVGADHDHIARGHQIRNLVPCCRTCNESKGQKPWREFFDTRNPPDKDERVYLTKQFLAKTVAQPVDTAAMRHKAGDELERFLEIRSQVFDLMKEADDLAAIIRKKVSSG